MDIFRNQLATQLEISCLYAPSMTYLNPDARVFIPGSFEENTFFSQNNYFQPEEVYYQGTQVPLHSPYEAYHPRGLPTEYYEELYFNQIQASNERSYEEIRRQDHEKLTVLFPELDPQVSVLKQTNQNLF